VLIYSTRVRKLQSDNVLNVQLATVGSVHGVWDCSVVTRWMVVIVVDFCLTLTRICCIYEFGLYRPVSLLHRYPSWMWSQVNFDHSAESRPNFWLLTICKIRTRVGKCLCQFFMRDPGLRSNIDILWRGADLPSRSLESGCQQGSKIKRQSFWLSSVGLTSCQKTQL